MKSIAQMHGIPHAALKDWVTSLPELVMRAMNQAAQSSACSAENVVVRVIESHPFDRNHMPFEVVVTVSPEENGTYGLIAEDARLLLAALLMRWLAAKVLPNEMPCFGSISITFVCGADRSGCTLHFATRTITDSWGCGPDIIGTVIDDQLPGATPPPVQ